MCLRCLSNPSGQSNNAHTPVEPSEHSPLLLILYNAIHLPTYATAFLHLCQNLPRDDADLQKL